jgi:drug/metabolite transporter (DMT)-like permease
MSTGLAFVGFLALVGGALWLMLRPPSRATISAATIPAVLAAMAAMAASATVVAEEEETVVEAVLRSDLDSTTLAIVVLLGVAAVGGLILCILMPGQPRHPVEQSINDQVASKQWAGGLDQAPPPPYGSPDGG